MPRPHTALALTTLLLLPSAPQAATTPLTLSALDAFGHGHADLLHRRGPVRTLLIQSETVSNQEGMHAESATAEINRTNTALTLTYQQADRREYRLAVDAQGRQITATAITQNGKTGLLTDSVYRFNAAGCNHSATHTTWTYPAEQAATPRAKAPNTYEVQTFCDARVRPTRAITTVRPGDPQRATFTMVDTWKWSPDRTWVAVTGREYEGKQFFNARGDVVTEIGVQPDQRREVRTTYTYDARGNWTRRVTTVREGQENLKVLPLASTTTVTREITYW